jgi:competence protein ComFC
MIRCISCSKLSLEIICKDCQKHYLKADIYPREIEEGFINYSFYQYDEIKNLLNTKYQFYGDKVYHILAKNSFEIFAQNFEFDSNVYAIPIDDKVRGEFAHTAILSKYLQSRYIKPLYNTLQANNDIKYAGQTKEFREDNPRDFKYSGQTNIDVILVDDILTTGTTIKEAKKILLQNSVDVLFSLTLSDARN